MTTFWTRYAIASLAVALWSTAVGEPSAVDSYERCMSGSAAFAQDENLNRVVADYLANIQREIDSSMEISRVADMAGLKDRSKQARLRADQYRQELQQACAQLSQSLSKTDQRPKDDEFVPLRATQTEERDRQAIFESEVNRRFPGATFLMNEVGFSQWLDSMQGTALRRDLWEKARLANDFEQVVQMLRDYERKPTSK